MIANLQDAATLNDKLTPHPTTAQSAAHWNATTTACACAIVLIACALRVYRIGVQDLWLDEAFSWHIATVSPWLDKALSDNNPPLYFLLLRMWIRFAGESEHALRLLSAGFGALFVVMAIRVGHQIFTPRIGLWSGFWAAVASLHIAYSQQARAYTLLTLALLLTYGALWRALEGDTWRAWAGVSFGALVALYSHYFAVLGLLPSACIVAISGRGRWMRYAAAMLLSFALFLPWVVGSFALAPHSLQGTTWIPAIWKDTPPLLAIPRTLELFGLGGHAVAMQTAPGEFSRALPAALRLIGISVLAFVGVSLAVPWGDVRVAAARLRERKAALWLMLLVPLLVLWSVSFLKPLYVVGRYDLVAFPACPLLLGLAFGKIEAVAGRRLAWLLALALLVPVGAQLAAQYRTGGYHFYRATAQALDARVESGDLVVFTQLGGLPVLYQLHHLGYRWREGQCQNEAAGRRFGCRMFPRETEQTPAVYDPIRVKHSPQAVREDTGDFLRGLAPTGNVHVVFGKFRAGGGRLTIPPIDSRFVAELRRRGWGLASAEPDLGIARYRKS